MSHLAVISLLLLLAPFASASEVWKCQSDGKLIFSDVPCPTAGKPVELRSLQANLVQAAVVKQPISQRSAPIDANGRTAGNAQPDQPQLDRPAQNVCPTDLDIRNMETSASSNTIGATEKTFLADEVRRARQCRKGQGNYTAEDWRALRDAHNAQSSFSSGADARVRAEGIHSAADPVEGDRIARKRAQEDSDSRLADTRRHRKYQMPRPL